MLIEVSPCEVLLVTGGWQGGWYPMLSTELLVPGSGSWRLTGLLHRPMEGVGVATVDNTVFLTGDYIVHYCELGGLYPPMFAFQVAMTATMIMVATTTMTRSSSSMLLQRSGGWLAAWWSLGVTMQCPPSTLKMSAMFVLRKFIKDFTLINFHGSIEIKCTRMAW